MTKIGARKIYFWGSNVTQERVVRKDASGRYFVTWYGQNVEVVQADGFEGASNGWKTIEAY